LLFRYVTEDTHYLTPKKTAEIHPSFLFGLIVQRYSYQTMCYDYSCRQWTINIWRKSTT